MRPLFSVELSWLCCCRRVDHSMSWRVVVGELTSAFSELYMNQNAISVACEWFWRTAPLSVTLYFRWLLDFMLRSVVKCTSGVKLFLKKSTINVVCVISYNYCLLLAAVFLRYPVVCCYRVNGVNVFTSHSGRGAVSNERFIKTPFTRYSWLSNRLYNRLFVLNEQLFIQGLPKHRTSPQNTANHSKSPQIRPQFTANQVQVTSMMPQLTANQYKRRKSPQNTTNHNK